MNQLRQVITSTAFLFMMQTGFAQELAFITDWTAAQELAQKEHKQILIILTGSTWCAPCKKMDKNLFENDQFKKYAHQNLILFLVDLPGGGLVMNSKVYKDYEYFKGIYDARALPSLILTDHRGKKISVLKGKMFKLENVLAQLKAKA